MLIHFFHFTNFHNLLAPYGGQNSSSCGGLVAFGYQMGALRAPKTNTNTYIAQKQIQIHV